MQSTLFWLLGVDPEKIEKGAELSLRFSQSVEGWVVFLCVIGVLGFTVWVYRSDGKETASPAFRFILGTMRAVLLAIALLILLEPLLIATHTEVKRSSVLVLIDDSFSMSLGFPHAEEQIRKQIVTAMGPNHRVAIRKEDGEVALIPVEKLEQKHFAEITRMQVALQALRNDTISELEKKHDVRCSTFSGRTEESKLPRKFDESFLIDPLGQDTRIGDAMRQSLKEMRGIPLAGVILITDGRHNAGEDPVHVASTQYKLQRIPIYAVSVGDPGEPKDIEISVDGPEFILPDDPSELLVDIRQRGYKNLGNVRVELRNGEKLIEAREVQLGEDAKRITLPMQFREEKAGKYVYTVTLPVQEGELRAENNIATYEFQVVDKKVKVLFVEGQDQPRWEYRYLKNALIRDHTTEADVLLARSEGEFLWDGSHGKEPIATFPNSKKEIGVYDVIIFGDLNPIILTNDQQKLICDFVREGGAFILIAGERYAPSAYIGGPLAELLPVIPHRGGYMAEETGFQESFPISLTSYGLRQAWTHLEPQDGINKDIWANLPQLYWYFPVKRSKETADVVAVHPFHRDETGEKMPLIVTMSYGSGKSMYIGVDSLWRWRRGVGDRYHYRFYNQAIRYLSISKRLGGQKRISLGVDKLTYAIGDKVTINAQLKNEKFEPLTMDKATLYYHGPDKKTKTIPLKALGGQPGSYEGDMFPTERGNYTLWYKDDRQPEMKFGELTFKVDVPQLELEDPRMHEELLINIAAHGGEGGRYFTIDRMSEIPPLIQPKEEKVPREIPLNLWANWVVLLLFTALITGEWILRKYGRMI